MSVCVGVGGGGGGGRGVIGEVMGGGGGGILLSFVNRVRKKNAHQIGIARYMLLYKSPPD